MRTIKLENIIIPANYVLVLPDEPHEKFHLNGKETLSVGNADLETVASHYSIRGKVYQVPERLDFKFDQMMDNRVPAPLTMSFDRVQFFFRSHMVENEYLKRSSILYETKMQVKVGDTVFFKYQEHYACYAEGRWVYVDGYGEMMLMKYDQLICCHPAGNDKAITMLNGFCLIEPVSAEKLIGTKVYERYGVLFPVNDGKSENDMKKKGKLGYVRFHGEHVPQYWEESDRHESAYDFNPGDVVLYNSKRAQSLEYNLHKTAFDGLRLIKIQRRDIFCIFPNDYVENIDTLVLNIHK